MARGPGETFRIGRKVGPERAFEYTRVDGWFIARAPGFFASCRPPSHHCLLQEGGLQGPVTDVSSLPAPAPQGQKQAAQYR
jgi:hypothetical protein